MNENTTDFRDYNLIRKFLLHKLDAALRMKVEEKFFCEPEYKEFALIIEEELLEDYVLKRLTSDERLKVEKYLLSTREQQKKLQSIIELMQTVKNFSDETSSEKTFIEKLTDIYAFFLKSYVFGIALLLICFCALAVFLLNRKSPSSSLNTAMLERIETLNRENADVPENASSAVFEISRLSERSPSSANNRVFVKPDDKVIEYQLAIREDQYENYQAILNKFNSSTLVTVKNLSLSQKNGLTFLRVKFPAEIFNKGYYEINVKGIAGEHVEDLGTYSFEIFLIN